MKLQLFLQKTEMVENTAHTKNTTEIPLQRLGVVPQMEHAEALSLTHDLLCVLSMDTWWNFGHELKKKKKEPAELRQGR
jgi:hypothetical protein